MSKTINSLDELENQKKRKKIIFHSPLRYIIMSIICGLIILTYILNNGNNILYFSNAFFISGVVSMSTGLLSLSAYLGTFDGMSYTTIRLARGMFARPQKYQDYNEYLEEKKSKKDKDKFTFIPYIVIGLILIIVGAILAGVYNAQYRG